MTRYNPEQPNAPPTVESLTDAELLAMRDRCKRELGRRAMSVDFQPPSTCLAPDAPELGMFLSMESGRKRRSQAETARASIRTLLSLGETISERDLVDIVAQTNGIDADFTQVVFNDMLDGREVVLIDERYVHRDLG
jgi:hypothetical protein